MNFGLTSPGLKTRGFLAGDNKKNEFKVKLFIENIFHIENKKKISKKSY